MWLDCQVLHSIRGRGETPPKAYDTGGLTGRNRRRRLVTGSALTRAITIISHVRSFSGSWAILSEEARLVYPQMTQMAQILGCCTVRPAAKRQGPEGEA